MSRLSVSMQNFPFFDHVVKRLGLVIDRTGTRQTTRKVKTTTQLLRSTTVEDARPFRKMSVCMCKFIPDYGPHSSAVNVPNVCRYLS